MAANNPSSEPSSFFASDPSKSRDPHLFSASKLDSIPDEDSDSLDPLAPAPSTSPRRHSAAVVSTDSTRGSSTLSDTTSGAPEQPRSSSVSQPARKTSISFHPSTASERPTPARRLSQLERSANLERFPHRHETMESESSADENTSIMRKERTTGVRSYNTGGVATGASSTAIQNGTISERSSTDGRSPQNDRRASGTSSTRKASSQSDGNSETSSWWHRFVEKYGSVELENKGSVARDHLALERTFLAWLRTSLSFASIGIAVTQLFRLNTTLSDSDNPKDGQRLKHVGKPLGATFLAIGILVLGIGFHRYFESQHYVILGKFPASRGSVLTVTFVAFSLIVASLIVILSIAPSALET